MRPIHLRMFLGALLAAAPTTSNVAWATDVSASPSSSIASPTTFSSVNGVYPLWEQTGILHPAGTAEIGFGHAQWSFGPVQAGVHPVLFFYGAVNGELKASVWKSPRLRVALVTGAYRLPVAAEGRTIGKLHAVGFSNPFAPVWLVPTSVAASVAFSPRLLLHTTSTALATHSSDPRDRRIALGQSGVLEFRAGKHWGAYLHGGVEGWPVMTQGHAGMSLGYHGDHVRARLGYGRRVTFDAGSTPLFLFDFALLFS